MHKALATYQPRGQLQQIKLRWGGDINAPASFAASGQVKQLGWQAQLGLDYTGSQTSSGEHLPAYTLWNASLGRAWSVGDGRTLHLRTGLQNIGNLRLADKSPSFGYAEQGRRLFVNARLDF